MTLSEQFNIVINDMKAIIEQLKNSALWQDPEMPKKTIEQIKKIAKKIYALSKAREKVPDFAYARLEVQFTTAAVQLEKTTVRDIDRVNAADIIEAVISNLQSVKNKLQNA